MRNDLVDNIRLNMNAEQVRACVYVRAGDTRARTLHFTIVKDGQVVGMTDLVIAELVILKPDGHECDQSMTRYGNELHYTLRTQDINVPGDNRAQIQLTFSDGTVYESPEFSIMVYDKLDPRYETSTNEYTALNAKLALADETVEDAQEALDAAEALLDDAGDLRDEMVQLKDDTEGFKNDASQSASDASGYASDASGYATSASGSATLSESWAVGGTNTRAGEDTNNSKYWSQQASNSASSASGSATAAAGSATSAESWAVGGTSSRAGEDTNNAKYWSDTASGAASDALLYKNDAYNSKQDAAGYASDAQTFMLSAYGDAKKAESWAVGGTGTRPGEDTNNAKYWATQATVNDGTLTITQNGTPLGTFTANSASNVSIEVPGGGGHTIIDPDDTSMTQRAGLAFVDAHVSDDSVNDETEIEIVEAISKTDWDNLDPTDPSNNGLYEIEDPNDTPILDDTQVAHGNSTVSAILSIIDKAVGSGLANSLVYREEITAITAEMWASIADGTFSKVHAGMHYTAPSGRTYWFADADYFFGSGNTEQTSHHMLVVEDEISHASKQNNSNSTSGGATASLMYTTYLPSIQSELETDFGTSHIKTQSIMLNQGGNAWDWVDKSAFIMNARMVLGNPIGNVSNEMYNGGNRMRQLSLFRAMPETIIGRGTGGSLRAYYWLDDVESGADFGIVGAGGQIYTFYASAELGVRRAFLIG